MQKNASQIILIIVYTRDFRSRNHVWSESVLYGNNFSRFFTQSYVQFFHVKLDKICFLIARHENFSSTSDLLCYSLPNLFIILRNFSSLQITLCVFFFEKRQENSFQVHSHLNVHICTLFGRLFYRIMENSLCILCLARRALCYKVHMAKKKMMPRARAIT